MPSSQVMKKFSAGKLRSGGKGKGHPKVTNPKQAVAIMYSERREENKHGGHYPERPKGLGGLSGKKKKIEDKHKTFNKALHRV